MSEPYVVAPYRKIAKNAELSFALAKISENGIVLESIIFLRVYAFVVAMPASSI